MLYATKSGSVYEVDGLRVRRLARSKDSTSERVSAEWREAVSITGGEVGTSLVIIWGFGSDEHSATAEQVGDGEGVRLRTTVTTPVIQILDYDTAYGNLG